MRDGDDRRGYLHQQLYPCAQIDHVVDSAAGDYQHRAEQDAAHLPGDVRKQHHAEQEAQEYGQPSHAGDGVVVYAALPVRDVYGAHFCCKGLDHRRGRKAYGESYGDGEQYPHPQLQIEQHI